MNLIWFVKQFNTPTEASSNQRDWCVVCGDSFAFVTIISIKIDCEDYDQVG